MTLKSSVEPPATVASIARSPSKATGLVTDEIDAAIVLVQRHRAAEQDERAVDVVEARERSVAIDLREAQPPVEVIERRARRRHDDVARRAAAVLPGSRRVVGAAEDAEHAAQRDYQSFATCPR